MGISLGAAPIDRAFLPQDRLDLPTRGRLSLLPWKGQFTPEFVDVLLDVYLPKGGSVLDPFAGSGTVLFEASRRGVASHGAEINDAALAFCHVAELRSTDVAYRQDLLAEARSLLRQWPQHGDTKLRLWDDAQPTTALIEAAQHDANLWHLVCAAAVLAQVAYAKLGRSSVLKALARIGEIVLESTQPLRSCSVYRADARGLPIDGASVDLVVTSPPYINVHNYHQYGRVAVELLGGNPLEAARSEIGANRKFRQNRFFTVVQYAIDMAEVLVELRRVLNPLGRAIFVVGRESRVRGISFQNGHLLIELARRGGLFEVQRRMERSFVNRFGAVIFEDIIELVPTIQAGTTSVGRSVGIDFLRDALCGQVDEAQRRDLESALAQAKSIEPSPYLSPTERTVVAV
jgi:16S rRNA G966 N2-methylase RsmD